MSSSPMYWNGTKLYYVNAKINFYKKCESKKIHKNKKEPMSIDKK